jgi:hypothetical protein
MKLRAINIFKIISVTLLISYIFYFVSISSSDWFWPFFITIILLIPLGIIISTIFIVITTKNDTPSIFCFYIVAVLLSIFLSISIYLIKENRWENEMYRNVGIIENYYAINGVIEIDKNNLLELGIKENIHIIIKEDKTYYIVNKNRRLVYLSDQKRLGDYDTIF